MKHFTHHYLRHPMHKVTIDLIGVGGTGSQVLNNLARMNHALIGLDHPGLHVRTWDPDMVTDSNIGRQLFSPADLHQNKALVLTSRVNRFFGTEWESVPTTFSGKDFSNITISCVDSAAARIEIDAHLKREENRPQPYNEKFYWLDMGNLQKTGQVILGTLQSSSMPSKGTYPSGSYSRTLKTVVQKFPQLKKIKDEDQGPSCSLAEALQKQDLFINSILAQFSCNLLWKLIREGELNYHGCFVNLETLSVNPIKIL